MFNLSISVLNDITVAEADRDERGNLLPEAEKRIVETLAECLPELRTFSIRGVAQWTHTAFDLARRLRSSAIAKWQTDHAEDIELQKEKTRRWIDEMEILPPECRRVRQIKNTMVMISYLNALERNWPSAALGKGGDETQFKLVGRIGKNTQKHFETHGGLDVIEQDGDTINTTESNDR